jgi:hypothetical protein
MKTWRNGGIAPQFSFTPLPLHPWERAFGAHWLEGHLQRNKATGWVMDSASILDRDSEFSFRRRLWPARPTLRFVQWLTWNVSTGIKRLARETDGTSNGEVHNYRICETCCPRVKHYEFTVARHGTVSRVHLYENLNIWAVVFALSVPNHIGGLRASAVKSLLG